MLKQNPAALICAVVVCVAAVSAAAIRHADVSPPGAAYESPRLPTWKAEDEIVLVSNNYDSPDWAPPLYFWPDAKHATESRSSERKTDRATTSPDWLSDPRSSAVRSPGSNTKLKAGQWR